MNFTSSNSLRCAVVVAAVTGATFNLANAEPSTNVQGYWETGDGAFIVEVTECETGSPHLCAFIRAIPGAETDRSLALHVGELCDLPILFNLIFEEDKQRWSGGEIFDPETEQLFDAYIQRQPNFLKVRAFDGSEWLGETFKWISVPAPISLCRD